MIAKIKVVEAKENPTKNGKTYLNVKSDTGGTAKIWQENQYIWHLFVPGAELEVEYMKDTYGTTITGVVGEARKEPSGGIVIATNKTEGIGYYIEQIYHKLEKMQELIEFLVEEKKALTVPPVKEKEERPSLDDDIKPSDIPF